MYGFLKETIEGKQFELFIDSSIFSLETILKTAYNFLDIGYFFFKIDSSNNIILQYTAKDGITTDPKTIIGNFSDSLLEFTLRQKLELDNKVIRETIVSKAINGTIDEKNFVSFDSAQIANNQQENNGVIDFDKDIDDILKEIENDPELKIDEAEIEKILKEIEEESKNAEAVLEKPNIIVNPNALKDAKKKFQN